MPEPPAIAGGTPVREAWLGYGGQDITDAEVEAVTQALRGELITRGPTVEAFEAAVAARWVSTMRSRPPRAPRRCIWRARRRASAPAMR
jgi:hypothetical protein